MQLLRHGRAFSMSGPARLWLTAVAWLTISAPVLAQRWSPDGVWLAYVHASDPGEEPGTRLGWLLGQDVARPPREGQRSERLWATKVANRRSILLDQVEGSLTEPSWAANGSALAYGRMPAGERPARFELVVQDEINRKRVVSAWTWQGDAPTLDARTRREVALAPRMEWAVAPMLKPAGLVLVRLKDGKAIAQWPGARNPAWSSDDRLAMVFDGAPGRLVVYDPAEASEPATVTEVDPSTVAPPRWASDGQTLQVLSRSSPRGMRLERWRVVRGQPPSRQGEGIEVPDFVQVGTGPAPATFGLDHDGENLFQTVQHAGQPSVITWIRTAGGEVHKRFNPLIESMPVQGLSVAPRPGSLLLAYRPSESDVTVPPGLCNPTSETFEPLIPDEAARRAWLKLIFPVLESQVEKSLSGVAPAEAAGWKDRRPTRLPIPGELDAEDPNRLRIVRLAKLGQSVARRDVPEGPDSAARAPRDGWAELILDDLAGDYENALAWLDRLETSVEGREARTRLLGLRAQMSLGMRKVDRAGPIVDYLRVVEGEELAAINSKLSDITNPTLSWVARLQEYVNKKETDDSISDSQDLRGRISVPRGADVINQELPPRP